MKKLVFVHIPKTGGTSIRSRLKSVYKLKLDKSEGDNWREILWGREDSWSPFAYNIPIEEYNCILGHFPLSKYQHLQNEGWKFATWLRDPVERMISHYNWLWKRKDTGDIISFTKRSKNFCNSFLDVDLDILDFVGFTETFNKSFTQLDKSFGVKTTDKGKKRITKESNKVIVTNEERKIMKEILVKEYEMLKKFKGGKFK